jgi:hypothetical protein
MSRRIRPLLAAGLVTGAAAAIAVSVIDGGGAGIAFAGRTPKVGPVVTRAALDPALVAGRGATVDFAEQEAENAVTNGSIVGPDRSAYTLAAEASGRSAVRLTSGCTRTGGSPNAAAYRRAPPRRTG